MNSKIKALNAHGWSSVALGDKMLKRKKFCTTSYRSVTNYETSRTN